MRTALGRALVVAAVWLGVAYPAADDVDGLRRQAAGLTTLRQQLERAEDELQQWTRRKGQEVSLLQNVQRLQNERQSALVRCRAGTSSSPSALSVLIADRCLASTMKASTASSFVTVA